MLYYCEIALSNLEVPNETSLCIYISGCLNNCANCHYPELKSPDYGDILKDNYYQILTLYMNYANCVCFMGEGRNTEAEQKELSEYSAIAHSYGLKTCLYSGRNTDIEKWMETFDYVKTGRYMPEKGPINTPQTNQRMYKKCGFKYIDITSLFWN